MQERWFPAKDPRQGLSFMRWLWQPRALAPALADAKPHCFSDAQKWSLGEAEKTARLQSGVLAFCTPLLREAAYELWPKAQRMAMHCKCAAFLERQAHKCQCCGGGDFVAFHRFAVSSTQEGQSCDNYASECYSPSWEASPVKNEMRRDEVPATRGMLSAVLWSLGPPHCACTINGSAPLSQALSAEAIH